MPLSREIRLTFRPFSIECQTCTSKLRVTNAELVDSIVACPKCQSMVQIGGPPTPQFALGSAPVDSAALTEDSIESELAESDPAAPPPSGFQESPSMSTDPESGDFGDPPNEPVDPLRPAWESEKTAKSRQVALLVALGSTALVSSVLVFVLFIRGWGKTAIADVQPDQSNTTEIVEQPESGSPTDDQDSADHQNGNHQDANDFESQAAKDSANDPSNDDDNAIQSDQDSNLTPDGQTSDDANDPNSAEPPNESPALSPLEEPLTPKNDNSETPLDADPPEDNDDGPMPTELPPELGKIIFRLEEPLAKPNQPAPPTIDDLKIDRPTIEPNDPTLISSPPEPINARRALGVKMALNAAGGKYPLNDLTLLISQISGVPIHLEWVSFDLVGTDIGAPVGVPKGWLSVQELLNQLSASSGAELKVEEYFIRLQPTSDRLNAATDGMMDLSDLKSGQTEPADLLNRLLYGKPNPVAPSKLIEPVDLNSRQLTSIACEAFRRARNVQGKIPDETLFRWSVPLDHPNLQWPIVSGVQSGDELFSSDAAASLLRRIARGNRATCYINWIDANRKRMSPVQRVMPYMGPNVDGGTAIADALEPFGLQARKVDEQHWWVGTSATYDQFPVITWTKPLANPDEFKEKFAMILAANDGVKANLVIDPETNRAMLMVPRYLLRQLPKVLGNTP